MNLRTANAHRRRAAERALGVWRVNRLHFVDETSNNWSCGEIPAALDTPFRRGSMVYVVVHPTAWRAHVRRAVPRSFWFYEAAGELELDNDECFTQAPGESE